MSYVTKYNLSVENWEDHLRKMLSRSIDNLHCQQGGWEVELVGRRPVSQGGGWGTVGLHRFLLPTWLQDPDHARNDTVKIIMPDHSAEELSSFVDIMYSGEAKLPKQGNLPSLISLLRPDLNIYPGSFEKISVMKSPSESESLSLWLDSDNDFDEELNDSKEANSTINLEEENSDIVEVLMFHGQRKESKHETVYDVEVEETSVVKRVKRKLFQYLCQHCALDCPSFSALLAHTNKAHQKETFQCEKCNYRSKSLVALKQHAYVKHIVREQGRFTCNHCGYKADSRQTLINHRKSKHSVKKVQHEANESVNCRVSPKSKEESPVIGSTTGQKENLCPFCTFSSECEFSLRKHRNKYHKDMDQLLAEYTDI